MKKKIKAEVSHPPQPKAGFFGAEYRSPLQCEFNKATELSYLQSGHKKAMEIRESRKAWSGGQEQLLRNQAHSQGGYTFDLAKGIKPDPQ